MEKQGWRYKMSAINFPLDKNPVAANHSKTFFVNSHRRCSVKKVFLKILQSDSSTDVFL